MPAAERDAALLPGPTAAQWSLRGSVVMIVSIAILLATIFFEFGLAGSVRVVVTVVSSLVCVGGIVSGFVFVAIGGNKKYRELRAGYSTLSNENGIDYRHSRTGALLRSHSEAVEKPVTKRVYDGMGPAGGTPSRATGATSTTAQPEAEE